MDGKIVQRSVEQMWQDYLFLTNEMIRFLEIQEFDLLNQLLDQRAQLQKLLDEQGSKCFFITVEGKAILGKIKNADRQMMTQLQCYINKDKQQQKVAVAYEGLYDQAVSSRMDWKR